MRVGSNDDASGDHPLQRHRIDQGIVALLICFAGCRLGADSTYFARNEPRALLEQNAAKIRDRMTIRIAVGVSVTPGEGASS
jgi:hypothetical protein